MSQFIVQTMGGVIFNSSLTIGKTPSTALLWFSPHCGPKISSKNKALSTNHQLQLNINPIALEQAQTLKFTIGIPFKDNHANPLLQASPLNNPEMFWAWRTGHKFLRLDISSAQPNKSWAFHLGSVGCTSASSLRSPYMPCAYPNTIEIELNINQSINENHHNINPKTRPTIIFNLAALFHKIDISNAPPCMFNTNQQELCAQLMQNLQAENTFVYTLTVQNKSKSVLGNAAGLAQND